MPPASEEQSPDGWTRIVKGKKKTACSPQNLNSPAKDLTVSKVTQHFNTMMNIWQQSECRQQTIQILQRIRPEHGWNVRNAVCLATGSFSRDNLECRRRSMWQMVVFADLARHIQADGEGEYQLVAQDPQYTPLDRLFLAQSGIAMLQTEPPNDGSTGLGSAKQYLQQDTFIYEPFLHMSQEMLQEIVEANPRLYIGSSIHGMTHGCSNMDRSKDVHSSADQNTTAKHESGTPVNRVASQFCEQYNMYRFPTFEIDPNIFEGMFVFWKIEEDDES